MADSRLSREELKRVAVPLRRIYRHAALSRKIGFTLVADRE